MRAATGVAKDRELPQPKVIREIGDIGRPVDQSPPGLEGRTSEPGPVGADEHHPCSLGGIRQQTPGEA